ncbi:MAG: polyprenol monophosphomannose synthase [Candidatus Bathyarchaeota archaeon]|nr:polyprenol monophosphomannose synthase [Candidatus Bathyarchaeota archaeon]
MNTQVSYSIGSKNETSSLVGSLSLENDSCGVVEGNLKIASEIGIILPTYCEAANIERLVNEIENLDMNVSLLVIDDSSPDGSADIVRKLQRKYNNILLLVRSKKMGLGTAITDGFKSLLSLVNPPEYIVTMDADYSHNPKDVPHVVSAAKEGKGLAIGSRYCKGGRIINWSLFRLVTSRIANLVASSVVGAKIHDYTSGLRCYSATLVKAIVNDLHSQTYEIQIETIRQACKREFNIKEVPITFINRKKGKSKLTPNEIREFISYILNLVHC